MNRKEFISKLGINAAFALSLSCQEACVEKYEEYAPRKVNFTLDLRDPSSSNLLRDEGFVIIDCVVVARTIEGKYVAATQSCDKVERGIRNSDKSMGQRQALANEPYDGLTIYNTSLYGSLLHIYSK